MVLRKVSTYRKILMGFIFTPFVQPMGKAPSPNDWSSENNIQTLYQKPQIIDLWLFCLW